MSCYVNFRSRLASIMGVLAEAAVTEINELMEDGYAVLRLEISRQQKENDALKKKLHMTEMRIARCFRQNVQATEGSVGTGSSGTQVYGQLTPTETSGGDHFPIIDRIFGKQTSFSFWSDGEITSVHEDQSPSGHESITTGFEEGPESLLVKEEALEEDLQDSDAQGGLIISEESPVESHVVEGASTVGTQSAPAMGTRSAPAMGTQERSEQHSTRHGVWEDGRLAAVLKAEQEKETVKLQATAGRLNSLGNENVLCEIPGEKETFSPQRAVESESVGSACSYATRTDLETLPTHMLLVQASPTTTIDADKSLSSSGSCDGMDSVPFEVETGVCSSWDNDSPSGPVYTRYRHKKDCEIEKLLPESITNVFPTHAQMVPRDRIVGLKTRGSAVTRRGPYRKTCSTLAGVKTHPKRGTKERRFICNFCGKCFTSLQNLQTHVRVHTGERPFSCAQCGKRFTQAGHLKTHQSVHTGERPYICTQCGKQFAGKQNLRIHQQRKHQVD